MTKSLDFAQTLQNLGDVYLAEHKYDEAGPLFAQALTIKENSLGEQHPELAHVLTLLPQLMYFAATMLRLSRFAGAHSVCWRSLRLRTTQH